MKRTSDKLLKWNKKDYVLNVVTYLLNFALLGLLFVLMFYLQSKAGKVDFADLRTNVIKFFNFLILLFFTLFIVFLYFFFEERDFLKNAVNSEMIFLIIELCLAICFVFGEYVNYYLRPLVLATILVLFLTNSRTAVFTNFIFCIIIFLFDAFAGMISTSFSSIKTTYDYLLVFAMGVSSGIIAVYCLKEVHSRIRLFVLGFLISLPSVVCTVIPITGYGDANVIHDLLSSVAFGPLSVTLFTAILPFFEFCFNKVSSFKLGELTDHKSRIVRKIITKAPGTFNHSIVVSNIAEACATAIGEDALLARTCAYYHDIGKLRRPEYFKENQLTEKNPHDDLTPELSANIISAHAQDGYTLALKNRLPKEIADVCREHHGTMPILFFYDKAKKFTDGEVDIAEYCYAGPKPQSKIAAIIMIADGCEAVARTLTDRSRENVKNAVKKIVNSRMELGQFTDCEITLKELNIIINTVVNTLSGVYHNRIDYPKVSLDGIDLEASTTDETL